MTSNNSASPLWKEGMFLTPQHLQQLERCQSSSARAYNHVAPPYPWGVKAIEIETAALSAFSFKLAKLEAITADGALIFWPGNIVIPSRGFEGFFSDLHQSARVYLGIPDFVHGGANLEEGEGKSGAAARFTTAQVELTDENSGQFPRDIQLKLYKGKIFFEGEDMQGHQVLPLARIKPTPNLDGAVIDELYMPPVLNLGAWPSLAQLAQNLAAKVNAAQSNLMRAVGEREIVELCGTPRGLELLYKIRAVNLAAFEMAQMSQTDLLPPYEFYLGILRIIGALWVFKGGEAIAKPPAYDHNNLGDCFTGAAGALTKLLSLLSVQNYIQRAFVPRHEHLEVDLEPDWVKGERKIYLRVSGAGDFEEAVKRLASVKLCAPTHLAQVLQRRMQGLEVKWTRRPPSVLPASLGGVFGEISQSGPFWPGVQEELMLAAGASEEIAYKFEIFVV
jgi:type VI secretion system protein ImpJ